MASGTSKTASAGGSGSASAFLRDAARKAALKHAGYVAGDGDPLPEREARRVKAMTARTVDDVPDGFLKHAKVKGLRSVEEMESLLRRYVRPKIGSRRINLLKRSDITDWTPSPTSPRDGRATGNPAVSLTGSWAWCARRSTGTPLGTMSSSRRSSRVWRERRSRNWTRDRVLDDDEIRTVWQALDQCGPPAYVRLVRALLFSAARLNEVARLQWPEIAGDVALVPASRTKTKVDHAAPLTSDVLALFGERAVDAGDFIFSTDHGTSPFSGFSKAKRRLDAEIAKLRAEAKLPPMPPWRLHDLRRSARSLLSRAKVDPDIAERVLGHALLGGIRRVYDKHAYLAEKRHALERLAALVRSIVEPPPLNVVTLHTSEAA